MVLRAIRRAGRSGWRTRWTGLVMFLAAAVIPVHPATAGTPDDEREPAVELIGPLQVPTAGRERVRGGRPEDGSIFVAWVPGIEDPDQTNRDALAAFERATFPPGARTSTIVDKPPASWMADLQRPDLPVRWNSKTVEYLRYFRDHPRGQSMIRAWMARAGRYEGYLRKVLREVGVPEDLMYVALAESGFNPRVRSRVGAAGLWQFMEGTGSVYGLQRDYWVDERLDLEKSTYAAALYLKDLRARFGSWELALAAYNAGYGLVMTSIARHNTNNFWTLAEIESGLPYATGNYIPKIVAAALVGRNRAHFGCDASSIEVLAALDWVEVHVEASTSLERIAATIGEDPDLVAELNAQLVRGRTPPRRASYAIRIPRRSLPRWQERQGELRAAWQGERDVVVREGESLEEIAAANGIDERSLRRMNGVHDAGEVRGGVILVVPEHRDIPSTDAPSPKPIIAAVPALGPGPGHRLIFFTVARSTTPQTLSAALDTPWEDIVRWNDLDPHARLQANQVLQLVVPNDFDAKQAGIEAYEPAQVVQVVRGSREHLEAELEQRDLVRRGYKVRRGDTLRRIGRRFGLSVGDLTRINAVARDTPEPGEILVVYVPRQRTHGTVAAPPPPDVYQATNTSLAQRSSPSTAETSRNPGHESLPTPVRQRRAPSTARSARLPGTH